MSPKYKRKRTRYCKLEMHLSQTYRYGLKLTFNQTGSSIIRKSNEERGVAACALLLATTGLSLSMFSLKQMRSCPQTRRRKLM